MTVAEMAALLNSLVTRHPEAISFATGRPADSGLPVEGIERWIDVYVQTECRARDTTVSAVRRSLGQYANTRGSIRTHLARYLAVDGPGHVPPDAVLVSNGGQEAIALCLAALVGRDKVCLAGDPVYFGLIGVAETFGFALDTVPNDDHFIDHLEARVARADAPPVGLVYAIPDFDNPTGRVMPEADRRRLVDLAETYGFHIFEDAVYRRFRYEGATVPTLKSMDRTGRVIYVESFAKTVMPGLRVAAVVAEGPHPDGGALMPRLVSVKSALSVTTAPLVQAVLAGLLIETAYRLDRVVAPRRAHLKRNRDRLVAALDRFFPTDEGGRAWPVPAGGFYMCFDPGTQMSPEDTVRCTEDAGVIVAPLTMFSPEGRWRHQVRLAFSTMTEDEVETGIARWAGYLRARG